MWQNTLVITLQFYRLIVVQAEKRKVLKSTKQPDGSTGKGGSQTGGKKRGVSPAAVDSARNLRGTRIVKVASTSSAAGGRGTKSPKSPKRAVAKLVRTASEDDGTVVYPSPAHSAAFLLHSENETSWRQYSARVCIPVVCPFLFRLGDTVHLHVDNMWLKAWRNASLHTRQCANSVCNVASDEGLDRLHGQAIKMDLIERRLRHLFFFFKGRRRSLSTGDLSVTAEMSVEIDSSPDRSTCFSADAEVGDIVESDFEGERLSNLEEEENDNEEANDDVESQSSMELEYPSRDKETSAFNVERKRRMNRYCLSRKYIYTVRAHFECAAEGFANKQETPQRRLHLF